MTNLACPRILVVDDEAHLRELLEITLIKMGLDVDSAENLTKARQLLEKYHYSLVLTDMRLPDGFGLELVELINRQYTATPVAVITAFGSAGNAVEALKAGAFDYVSKPVALDQLRKLVRSALEINELAPADVKPVESCVPENDSLLLGNSTGMQVVRAQITRLARSMAPVIIYGESGSGKELAAREIHARSARAAKPFVAVNCGAIPEALMEAEFFGYRKGSFTGAVDDREGFFQAANGGTLMLDEVADLPFAMQVKLLRAIQQRSIRKIGSTTEEPVDVRIISATHQDLAACVEQGKFRQDLYYRLNVIELSLPPLRERLEDIGLLTTAILRRLGDDSIVLSDAAGLALKSYHFPGNVRELENILERAIAFASDGRIEVADLLLRNRRQADESDLLLNTAPVAEQRGAAALMLRAGNVKSELEADALPLEQDCFAAPSLPCCLPDYLEQIERELIRRALLQTRHNRTQAAELLGISFRQLRYQIQKLNIQE